MPRILFLSTEYIIIVGSLAALVVPAATAAAPVWARPPGDSRARDHAHTDAYWSNKFGCRLSPATPGGFSWIVCRRIMCVLDASASTTQPHGAGPVDSAVEEGYGIMRGAPNGQERAKRLVRLNALMPPLQALVRSGHPIGLVPHSPPSNPACRTFAGFLGKRYRQDKSSWILQPGRNRGSGGECLLQ